MTATTKQRLNARFGRMLVPVNHLLPILRDRQIVRFGEPGYVWINPWSEETLPLISTGYRSAQFKVFARSSDAHESTFEGGIGYLFDPRKAHDQIAPQLAKAVSKSEQPLNDILRDAVGPAIRDFVSRQPAHALLDGAMRLTIEAHVRSTLKGVLRPYGIQLAELVENDQPIGVKGVNLRTIHLPPVLTTVVDMAYVVANAATFNMSPQLLTALLFEQKNVEQASVNGNLVYLASSLGAQGSSLLQALQQGQNQLYTNGAVKAGDTLHRRLPNRPRHPSE